MMGQAKEFLDAIQMDEEENFSEDTIARFKSDPVFYRSFVKGIEVEVCKMFPIVSFVSRRRERK